MILITLLDLVYHLLASPFLTPNRKRRLIRSRDTVLGCTEYIKTFFYWLRVYMQQLEWAIVGMTSVNLVDAML